MYSGNPVMCQTEGISSVLSSLNALQLSVRSVEKTGSSYVSKGGYVAKKDFCVDVQPSHQINLGHDTDAEFMRIPFYMDSEDTHSADQNSLNITPPLCETDTSVAAKSAVDEDDALLPLTLPFDQDDLIESKWYARDEVMLRTAMQLWFEQLVQHPRYEMAVYLAQYRCPGIEDYVMPKDAAPQPQQEQLVRSCKSNSRVSSRRDSALSWCHTLIPYCSVLALLTWAKVCLEWVGCVTQRLREAHTYPLVPRAYSNNPYDSQTARHYYVNLVVQRSGSLKDSSNGSAAARSHRTLMWPPPPPTYHNLCLVKRVYGNDPQVNAIYNGQLTRWWRATCVWVREARKNYGYEVTAPPLSIDTAPHWGHVCMVWHTTIMQNKKQLLKKRLL